MTGALIALCVALTIVVIALLVALYHQMLLVNEVNKRLLVLTSESIDNERRTMDELNATIQAQEETVADKFGENQSVINPEEEEYEDFNPHDAFDSLE